MRNVNREILRLSIPNVISNVTVPLMGLVSTAIAGHCGDSAATIGALSIGAAIFNFIYWNAGFLRMGTSGMTAQAFGAGDERETSSMLYRSLSLAALIGVTLIALQAPIGRFSIWVMNGNDIVRSYFNARIWAVPAGVLLFAFNGWFVGMQNSIIPMCTAIWVNLVHIIFSFIFVYGLDMGVPGLAWASVVGQWSGVVMAAMLLWLNFRKSLHVIPLGEIMDLKQLKRFFAVNTDIIIRTACLCSVYCFFTGASAYMGSDTILAVNAMLMQLFTLFSYMNDGIAYAVEALTGRFIGARNETLLRESIRKCTWYAIGIGVAWTLLYSFFWRDITAMFLPSGSESAQTLIEATGDYIGWIIAVPLIGTMPFLYDGIMVGATRSRIMRDSMLVAVVIFYSLFFALLPYLGNNALWLSFSIFVIVRGVVIYVVSHRLEKIFQMAR